MFASSMSLTKFLLLISCAIALVISEPILMPRDDTILVARDDAAAAGGYGPPPGYGSTTTAKPTGPTLSASPTYQSSRALSSSTLKTSPSPTSTKKPNPAPTCGPSLLGSAKQNTNSCLLDAACTCTDNGIKCSVTSSLTSLCLLVCACI